MYHLAESGVGSWLLTLLVFGALAWGIGRIFITRDTPAGRGKSPAGARIVFGLVVLGLCLFLYKGCDGAPYGSDLDEADYYNARRP